jgi:hypothetical protein
MLDLPIRAMKYARSAGRSFAYDSVRRLRRSIYRNDAGLAANLRGTLTRARLRARRHYPRSEAANIFERDGYLPLQPVSAQVIHEIRAKYLAMIDDDRFSRPNANKEALRLGFCASRVIWDVFEKIPETRAVVTDEVAATLRALYGCDFVVTRTSAWRTLPIPDQFRDISAYSNRWHCDDHPTHWCKIFVHLQDITEEDGPFHALSRQNTAWALKTGFRNRKTYGLPDDVLDNLAHRSVGPIGSILLANTELCLHRAGVPASGRQRDMIEVFFSPK